MYPKGYLSHLSSMPSMPSTPSTPPSIPEDLMDLSSNKNNSHVDNDDGKEISSDEDENDVPSPDGNGNSSFKAVATPGEIQEESPFGWTRTPQSRCCQGAPSPRPPRLYRQAQ